jgi:ATP-dependent DNA helicase RecG
LYFSGKNYQFIQIKKGERYLVTGKPKKIGRKYSFRHPEIALANATDDAPVDYYNIGRITPIYSEMLGIKPSRFAKKIREHLDEIPQYFHEYLPSDFLKKFNLLDVATTLRHVHFPDSHELKDRALYRIFFDRLLRIQIFSLMNRAKYQSSRTQETQA